MKQFFYTSACIALILQVSTAAAQLKNGIDVLLEKKFALIEGKKIGLITNRTGTTLEGTLTYHALVKRGAKLVALFAPEHGFAGDEEAGKKIVSSTLGDLKIYSLYGKTNKPTPDMLADLDALLFDIQDVGTRCYTYISTMKLAMQVCADAGKEFIALDRPNPIAPIAPQGFMLDTAFSSFVGLVKVPFIHSLTIGELATLIQAEELPTLKLTVVKMENYDRTQFFDSVKTLKFIAPSPNLASVDAEILYPATVFLEGLNVSEGRGTSTPFEVIGAPFIDAVKLINELKQYNLSGVRFDTISFTPKAIKGKSENPKYRDNLCFGVRVIVVDRNAFQPFSVAVALLAALKKNHSENMRWMNKGNFFDKLVGTNTLRLMLDAGKSFEEITRAAQKSIDGIDERYKRARLY